ncbi:hypothetical protein [Thermococcus celer]|uniref:Uncharacterized protein n=1 Tax=Thermococcus celer Vu 13 = JCM 8558 TaxID=1293037 RepID=A0A218P212_THECE|nr:hypothetical protein [Thermococcus celer]ASI98938.1 hypothetical protein A3L02_04860 [Thermococcus celer Vu 13 = JCM 8558]
MKKMVYRISIPLAALFLFWPVLYGNLTVLRRIPGDPALQAIAGVLVFGGLAYLSYDEGEDEGITAS